MPARLVPLTNSPGPMIPIQRPVLLVGRHPECDVRIDLPKISRRHCCLALAYDRVVIRDLGSSHGVRVNGRVIDESRLVHGDEVAIGTLLYRLDDPEAVATPTSAKAVSVRPPVAAPPPSLPDLPEVVNTSGDLLPIDL